MAWCIANDLTEAAVLYGQAAGETDAVADLLEGLLLPLYFDGRMQTAEEWFGWFGEDDLAQHPVTRRLRSVDPRADRAARRCGAVAGARRRGDLDGPSARMAAPRSSRGSRRCART